MPVTVQELHDSRAFSVTSRDASLTLRFLAYRSDDEGEIWDEVLNTAPAVYQGLYRTDIRPTPKGGGVWEVEVAYGVVSAEGVAGGIPGGVNAPGDADDLGVGFSFDVSQQTVHVTQSITTVHAVAAGGGAAPDYKQAIGVTKDRVEGTDVFSGGLELTLTVPRASVNLPYMRVLKNMVGRSNVAPWYGFARGECLYLGASGQYTGDGFTPKFTVTHKIAVGENQTAIDVGNGITVPTKAAWQYLWVGYEEKDVGGGLVLQVPAAAYVEQVYREGDFTLLEIGG